MVTKHVVAAFSVVFLVNCVSTPRHDEFPDNSLYDSQPNTEIETTQETDSEDVIEDVSDKSNYSDFRIQEEDVVQAEKEEDAELNASLHLADHEQKEEVQRWIKYFSEDNKEQFERFLSRGMQYRKMIKSVLRKQKVPTYLYYLAMIESGFILHARSHASAVGIWQFIAPTARRYGLKIDSHVDERSDPIRATLAASEYLKDLYNVFQSWPLAMAAYNAGEMRIVTSIMKQKSRDFWDLARRKQLPQETRHYIPKFIAAALIGNHPEKYGLNIEKMPAMESVKAVAFPSPARLSSIAQVAGISLSHLKSLNPHIKSEFTPMGGNYRIWLPENINLNSQQIASIPVIKLSYPKGSHYKNIKRYKVRRGDSLAKIAKKFGISIYKLKKLNRMKTSRIQIGQIIRIDV